MTTTAATISGRALYVEAVHETGAVTQVLIMPEGVTSAHVIVPMTMYRRRISQIQPRKTWRQIASANTSAGARIKQADAISEVSLNTRIATEMLGFTKTIFTSLSDNGWKIRKEPVIVDVTPEDLEDSRQAKTPYKVFGRVWKARKAMGFPKEFLVVSP